MLDIVLTFLWAFLVALFAVPSIISVAHTKSLLDRPNHRTIHRSLTPRLGGLAIFAGFMSALTIFGTLSQGVQQLLAGCLIIFFLGVKDDLVSVSALKKFFVQILAGGIVMVIGKVKITSFQGILGIYELEPEISFVFTFLVIIGITNAINLLDGMDGLAGTVILVVSLVFGSYFYYYNNVYSYAAFALAGGSLGFLKFNIHKARIFMGDTGSLVSGFILSVLAIEFVEMKIVDSAPALAVGILILPIFDTLRVFSIRVFNGKWPFHPDRNHLHHKLLALGLSQLTALAIMITTNLLVISFMFIFSSLGNFQLLLITLIFAVFISLLLGYLVKEEKEDVVNA